MKFLVLPVPSGDSKDTAHCDHNGEKVMRISVFLSKLAAIASVSTAAVALGAAPAEAVRGSYLNCGALYAYTTSKSAGSTTHYQGVSGSMKARSFGNVKSENPYRTWSQGIHKLDPRWEVEADVLDYAYADCVRPG